MKSTPAELAALREACFARDNYRCKWPGCPAPVPDQWDDFGPLQMAHIEHRGMGGWREANRLENVITMCRLHHSIFDGREGSSRTRREIAVMLRAQIQ